MVNELNESGILRDAGFCSFERTEALVNNDNPLSPKVLAKGHWFYETVITERTRYFNQFREEAKTRGLTYNQFIHNYTQAIKQYYKKNGYRDFWAMFRDKEAKAKLLGWYTTPRPRGNTSKYEKSPIGIFMRKLNLKRIFEQRKNILEGR
jgi:hypothetical protein